MGNKSSQFYFDDNIPEILKLRKEGYLNKEIAKKVKRSESSVARTISSLTPEKWRTINKVVAEISKTRYFEWLYAQKRDKTFFDAKLNMLKKGYWPFGEAPTGYIKVDRKLQKDLKSPLAKIPIFKERAKGKSLTELSEDTGLSEHTLGYMLENPIYKGEYHYKGHDFKWPELAWTDPQTWKEAQPIVGAKREQHFGWRWIGGRERKVHSRLRKVKLVFKEAAKHKGHHEIACMPKIKLTGTTVKKIRTNRIYLERGIVDEKTYNEAQHFPESGHGGRRVQRQRRIDNIMKLRDFIRDHGPVTVKDVQNFLGVSDTAARKYLKLSKAVIIEPVKGRIAALWGIIISK